MSEASADREIGSVVVLTGERGGRYPHGNSVLVRGPEETVLIDPSLSLASRRNEIPPIDRVLHSHCHEDHVAGSHLFTGVPWHFHELDLPGIRSLDALMRIYGYSDYPEIESAFREVVVRDFHFTPRTDAVSFRNGDEFDLDGRVRVRVIHSPGHTRGHSFFHIEPDDVLYMGDVDLSSFGPYYGDAWSNLEDFERTLAAVREMDARAYATFHHIGVLDGKAAFLERLDRFAAVIADRERRLLEFLREPRTLAEIIAHRFVYRPQDAVPFAAPVEQRSMSQHLERCLSDGRIREVEAGRFEARGATA